MDITNSLATVALAGLIHASFQLSVSVLTLLSGHSIGKKDSASKLFRLTTSFVLGAGLITVLLLSSISLITAGVFHYNIPDFIWSGWGGLAIGVAISIWLFYYKKGKGTELWIPRPFADYLSNRSKATKLSAEAFGLGMTSVIAEILFIIAPLFVSSLVLTKLPALWQLVGITVYVIISMISLVIVWVLIGSGYSLAKIQKWREENKHFLQITAGSGLIVLTFYVYVTQIAEVVSK